MKKQFTISILIPETKYPYNCVEYQNETNDNKISLKKIEKTIKNNLSQINQEDTEGEIEVAFLGKPFNALKQETQEKLLNFVYKYIKEEQINSIRISLIPIGITNAYLKMLKQYKVKTIELETLSCNDYILSTLKATYTYKEIKKVAKKIKWKGFELGSHMMVGLPESTRLDEINTAKILTKLKPKSVRINPIYVIKNTKLEKEYEKGEYEPLNVVQATECCKELIRIFTSENIETIRIGYQDAEEELKKENIIAGPFHPEFRKLVEMEMWYDAIVGKIKKLNAKVREVEITVNPIDVENVIGTSNANVLKLKKVYDVDLIVKSEKEMKQGKSNIKITKICQ